MALSPRQIEFFDFLVSFQREYGYAPTIARIQEHFGLRSTASVHQKLTELLVGISQKLNLKSKYLSYLKQLLIIAQKITLVKK